MRRTAYSAFLIATWLALPGCTSAQLAKDEAVVHAGLVQIEAGINWAAANPAVVSAALDEALKLDPSSQHLALAVSKGKQAVAAGDLVTAQTYLHAAVALTTPASGPK